MFIKFKYNPQKKNFIKKLNRIHINKNTCLKNN